MVEAASHEVKQAMSAIATRCASPPAARKKLNGFDEHLREGTGDKAIARFGSDAKLGWPKPGACSRHRRKDMRKPLLTDSHSHPPRPPAVLVLRQVGASGKDRKRPVESVQREGGW